LADVAVRGPTNSNNARRRSWEGTLTARVRPAPPAASLEETGSTTVTGAGHAVSRRLRQPGRTTTRRSICRQRGTDDEKRLLGRPPFEIEDPLDRFVVLWVHGEAVERLGRDGHDSVTGDGIPHRARRSRQNVPLR